MDREYMSPEEYMRMVRITSADYTPPKPPPAYATQVKTPPQQGKRNG